MELNEIRKSLKEKANELEDISQQYLNILALAEKYEKRSEVLRNEIEMLVSMHDDIMES